MLNKTRTNFRSVFNIITCDHVYSAVTRGLNPQFHENVHKYV